MKKFTYFHCYSPELWDGYVKNGLIRENFGLRVMQTKQLPEKSKFNSIAVVGGELYNFVKEHRCPMYVDRLQGGDYIDEYEYDHDLIDEYKKLLGEDFLGFQMHEWMTNYHYDTMIKLPELSSDEWDEENISRVIKRKYPFSTLFLEAMTLKKLVGYGKPMGYRQLIDNMKDYYNKRAAEFDLIPCDSHHMMYVHEAEHGAKMIMPECGSLTPGMRVQMSFARGVCKAYGLMLGAYYECWGGDPFSCCTYSNDGKNEWFGDTGNEEFPYQPAGPNGGSSRSLQWRIHLYAYMSGAKMICEEWGAYNTFTDWRNGVLSEYGEVKKRFLDFVEKYPDVGEKLTPIASVISNDLPCLVIENDRSVQPKTYFSFELKGEELDRYNQFQDRLQSVFVNPVPMTGSEQKTLINSNVPDAVDIVNERDGSHLTSYKYLVDLTGEPGFEEKYANCISPDQVTEVLHRELPCIVEGGLHYMVNRRGDDAYYLTVFNHSGVQRSVQGGETIAPGSEMTAIITLKDGRTLEALEGSRDVELRDGKYYVKVGGGDWFFAAF